MKNKKSYLRHYVLRTLAINSIVSFENKRKLYQIEFIGKDFVFLCECERNGQIIFVPDDCLVILHEGF